MGIFLPRKDPRLNCEPRASWAGARKTPLRSASQACSRTNVRPGVFRWTNSLRARRRMGQWSLLATGTPARKAGCSWARTLAAAQAPHATRDTRLPPAAALPATIPLGARDPVCDEAVMCVRRAHGGCGARGLSSQGSGWRLAARNTRRRAHAQLTQVGGPGARAPALPSLSLPEGADRDPPAMPAFLHRRPRRLSSALQLACPPSTTMPEDLPPPMPPATVDTEETYIEISRGKTKRGVKTRCALGHNVYPAG